MSTKQLARTVIDGTKIHLDVPTGRVEGYLAGLDDYHYFLVTSDGRQVLVHKANAITIEIDKESTFGDEPMIDDLEKVVGPFRSWVRRELFSQPIQEAPARERAS